jgi:hypothetical protein
MTLPFGFGFLGSILGRKIGSHVKHQRDSRDIIAIDRPPLFIIAILGHK